jgi:hypothetical protein
MHLDEEQVQQLLHGELAESDERAARAHLEGCPECEARLAEATRDAAMMSALLGHLDHPAPGVTAEVIASRAHGPGGGRLRWAAGVLLALGAAGAAYAVPGSPVRSWVAAIAEWIQGRPEPARLAPVAPQSSGPALAGIAVIPGPRFVIQFTTPQVEGRASVSLTKGTEVVVQGPIGAATFTSGVDRLVIENAGSVADFDIQIPEAAPWVEIRVGNVRVLLKEGSRITTAAPAASTPYLLPLNSNGGIP